jgi:type I restriction enzyme, R subunit
LSVLKCSTTPEQLYEPPFTDIAPHGPEAFFPADRLGELTTVLNHVRDRATTAS